MTRVIIMHTIRGKESQEACAFSLLASHGLSLRVIQELVFQKETLFLEKKAEWGIQCSIIFLESIIFTPLN